MQGQLGVPLTSLDATTGRAHEPVLVHARRPRKPFRSPIQPGSALERRCYGEWRRSMAHLPLDERIRILVSLGPDHAWRLPPNHPQHRPVE